MDQPEAGDRLEVKIVSNTSPIHYLVLIDQVRCLESLFGKIAVPPAVVDELRHPSAPAKVRDWVENAPSWMVLTRPSTSPVVSEHLGPGEQEAIQIALDNKADLLIIDDRDAKREATTLRITCVGTLTILLESGRLNLLNFEHSLKHLCKTTNFRISPKLYQDLLRQFHESP
jgi:predicted nucleic acid-binding protein